MLAPTRSEPPKVYFAGKIQADNDWRSTLGLWSGQEWESVSWGDPAELKTCREFEIRTELLRYVGPFYVECGHMGICFGGHRLGGEAQTTCTDNVPPVYDLCRSWLERADFVFAWIDSPDAYGTLFELGYAAALRKRIFFAMGNGAKAGCRAGMGEGDLDPDAPDMTKYTAGEFWLPASARSNSTIRYPNVQAAFSAFIHTDPFMARASKPAPRYM